ncbi:hypothetical protein GGR56DRAFT_610159 [Xylariaceae sp. FL0804]|nr:hypothetical protein GGR56DRAFT_610159 [Xylariaceae sp. FL0804]
MSLAPAAAIQSSEKHLSTPTTATGRPAEKKPETTEKGDSKPKKRSLFGFGKQKQKVEHNKSAAGVVSSTPRSPPDSQDNNKNNNNMSSSAKRSATTSPVPMDNNSPRMHPSSPGRGVYHSSPSPRLNHHSSSSPATSQIFERDVHDASSSTLLLLGQGPSSSPAGAGAASASAYIPSHIQTEDHIPPVLDASSEAITDGGLSTDAVEIVTHANHQPASAAVNVITGTGAANPTPHDSAAQSWAEDLAEASYHSHSDRGGDESASNYGSLNSDSVDVRRLSFISFADVVQAEQVPTSTSSSGNRDSMAHLAGLTSLSSLSGGGGGYRSPSPIRSPVSSQGPGETTSSSPPTSMSGSVKGLSMSPGRKSLLLASPTAAAAEYGGGSSVGGGGGGELNVETMSQALRRTGSTDLGAAARSPPVSPIEGVPSR